MAQTTNRPELTVTKREVLGKKVTKLRRQEIIPANIYGHGVESVAIQVPSEALSSLLRQVSRSDIINLRVADDKTPRLVFIRHIQRDFIKDSVLHVDFQQISLSEKVRFQVPIHLVGEAPAVDVYGGALMYSLEEITVEGLPADIPPYVELDVSTLAQIDASLHVRDIPIPAGLVVLTDSDLVVAKVASTAKERAEAEALGVSSVPAAAVTEEEAAEDGE